MAATASLPDRILVRGVNWLGDAVMTTPALQRLRQALPGAHIALLTPRKLAELWIHHPSIDSVMTFEEGQSVMSVARRIREGDFDVGIVLPNSPRSALEVWLARVRERIGYARSWRNFFLTRPLRDRHGSLRMRKRSVAEIRKLVSERKIEATHVPPSAHQIHEYLYLVAALGANPAPVPPLIEIRTYEEKQVAERFGLDVKASEVILGLNAGAEYGPAKRWPLDRFIACALEVQRQRACRWIILGGPNEKVLGEEIRERLADKTQMPGNKPEGALNLAGQTSLRELCVLLKMCRALLTNDSGPMHVAAAVGTPVVAPFGSTSPELTGPGLPGDSAHRILRAKVPCSPCFLRVCPIDLRCLTGITVDQVAEAVLAAVK